MTFIDTNVLVYSVDTRDARKQRVAKSISVKTEWTMAALRIMGRYDVQFYDSLMLAAAESAGCDEILTEDLSDGQMYGSVKAVNPFKGL